jgi:hypothetical protein
VPTPVVLILISTPPVLAASMILKTICSPTHQSHNFSGYLRSFVHDSFYFCSQSTTYAYSRCWGTSWFLNLFTNTQPPSGNTLLLNYSAATTL